MNASKFDVMSLVRDASFHLSNTIYEGLLAEAEALPSKADYGYSVVVANTLAALPVAAVMSVPKFQALMTAWSATCKGGNVGEIGRQAIQDLLQLETSEVAKIAEIQTRLFV